MTVARISAVCWAVFIVMSVLGIFVAGAALNDHTLPMAVRVGMVALDVLLWWGPFGYATYLSMVVVKKGDRRLQRRGVRGTAVVLKRDFADTAIQTQGFGWQTPSVFEYVLDVSLPGRDVYRTSVRVGAGGYKEGSTVTVFASPHNRKRVAIEPGSGTSPEQRKKSRLP